MSHDFVVATPFMQCLHNHALTSSSTVVEGQIEIQRYRSTANIHMQYEVLYMLTSGLLSGSLRLSG